MSCYVSHDKWLCFKFLHNQIPAYLDQSSLMIILIIIILINRYAINKDASSKHVEVGHNQPTCETPF